MNIGTPLTPCATKVLLLGSGELGKELTIELMRLGVEVIACDSYANAPAMQVAHRSYVVNLLDGVRLREIVLKENPAYIVPEMEAIALEELEKIERQGFRVVPSASAALTAMSRLNVKRICQDQLDIPTARYGVADSPEEMVAQATAIGFPVMIKPIVSSGGKGQTLMLDASDADRSWSSASRHMQRAAKVLVEEFVEFEHEITLLAVNSVAGLFFCDPIGHRHQDGDYVESWQPHPVPEQALEVAKDYATRLVQALGGAGIYGVEFFLKKDGTVILSDVNPFPHDTGMVTMVTQSLSEFALHARAILGLPITGVKRHSAGASIAWKTDQGPLSNPTYSGLASFFEHGNVDLRIFGKPRADSRRRLGVVLAYGDEPGEVLDLARKSKQALHIGEAPL
jgi:phosphoribosylglycinamide formyltransferase 2